MFTRTRDFATEFAHSLSQLDELILLDIYPARELPIEGITSNWLLDMVDLNEKEVYKEDTADFSMFVNLDKFKDESNNTVLENKLFLALLREVLHGLGFSSQLKDLYSYCFDKYYATDNDYVNFFGTYYDKYLHYIENGQLKSLLDLVSIINGRTYNDLKNDNNFNSTCYKFKNILLKIIYK